MVTRFIKAIVPMVFLSLASAAVAYHPGHYQQFNDSNWCAGCDLSGAKMSGWIKTSASLENSNLSRANMALGNFAGTNFYNAIMAEAKLMHANFAGASFNNANLSNANLSYAVFANADLSGAYFNGANLSHANLLRTNFDGWQQQSAGSICHALLPDGSRGAC